MCGNARKRLRRRVSVLPVTPQLPWGQVGGGNRRGQTEQVSRKGGCFQLGCPGLRLLSPHTLQPGLSPSRDSHFVQMTGIRTEWEALKQQAPECERGKPVQTGDFGHILASEGTAFLSLRWRYGTSSILPPPPPGVSPKKLSYLNPFCLLPGSSLLSLGPCWEPWSRTDKPRPE